MNTKSLARQYDQLTPWERVPLILAAYRRGDEAEGERLARAAPVHSFRVPDHFGLSEGLRLLACALRLDQLDLAAEFWRVETFLAEGYALSLHGQHAALMQRVQNVQRMLAFRFVVLCDAWKQLCVELYLAPDALARYLPGNENVARMQELARPLAFTGAEALAYLRQRWDSGAAAAGAVPGDRNEYRIETVQDVVQAWREYLDEHRKSWA